MTRNRVLLTVAFILILLTQTEGQIHGEGDINTVCPERFGLIIDGWPMQVPYCRNFSIDAANYEIERAVIVVHGSSRTADSYFSGVMSAANRAGDAGEKTIIIAPQFLTEDDIEQFGLGGEHLFWENKAWKRGDNSKSTGSHPRAVKISSFEVIDRILEKLADRQKFPNLRKIVIAGHSAGGQFVNRYAAGSQTVSRLTREAGFHFRFIVTNPSSYVYFNGDRRVSGTVDQFVKPNAWNCTFYNQYKYGFNGLNGYMKAAGNDLIREQYENREVVYLLGGEDSDPNADLLDKTCAAMLQGNNRLERGIIYYNYLLHFFGEELWGKHNMAIIPGVGHSSSGIFNSTCGLRYLFDYNPEHAECGELPNAALYGNPANGATGSYFSFLGIDYSPNSTVEITVNGRQKIGTVIADGEGRFSFIVSTENADEGYYAVGTDDGENEEWAAFTLDDTLGVRPQQGSGTVFIIPAEVALTNTLFLPALLGNSGRPGS